MTEGSGSSDSATKTDRERMVHHLAEQKKPQLLVELLGFLRHNKKWWLAPLVLMLLLLGAILVLGGTAAAPFIYTIF